MSKRRAVMRAVKRAGLTFLALEGLQAALRERRVIVSQRGDAVRVAPHLYNTPDDVAALGDALRAAAL